MSGNKVTSLLIISAMLLLCLAPAQAQKSRAGTATANFLEIGFGSAGSAMGDAYVSLAEDLSSMYWNPAGLGYMESSEAQFTIQPWVVDISTSFVGVGLALPTIGTLALGITQVGYGEMPVTNLDYQEGTGEMFTASELAASLSYSRRLAQWFSFGASFKYINSNIWHSNANAMALDLGVKLNTHFFSPTGEKADGMNIGMSISNYGTRMKYDGLDLLQPIDILPNEQGNYQFASGKFETVEWELPLIFRVGVAVHPLVAGGHRLTLAVDALHPNNNTESVNVGAQYRYKIPAFGSLFLRGGYKGFFMQDSEFGPTFGGGLLLNLMGNVGLRIDYAYKSVGMLGNFHSYTCGVTF
ncbi:PorV/PorQ family protein [candidate division KSB1 bacterium]|nr:PorV/PorQ family protein [candidate division KSB1 bacterium]RQW10764.1 MAG: PorV/PorQ family protein [candidate division KSB1 bacterium]